MNAHAIQLDVLSVEKKTSICVEDSFAYSDGSVVFIHDRARFAHRAANCIEIWIAGGPEVRLIDDNLLNKIELAIGRNFLRDLLGLDRIVIPVEDCGGQRA